MRRMHATAAAPNFAGWHPLGLLGIAAALAGVLMLSHTLSKRTSDLVDPASVTKTATTTATTNWLESQRAGLSERLSRFPRTGERAAQIAALGAIAQEHGVVIGSGEYRNADSAMPGELAMLEVRLPLQGPPPAVRAFLASLQREIPWLAIDELLLERDGSIWRGEVRGRMFLREGA